MLRRRSRSEAPRPVLRVGNLHVRRDWGFAPDFVDGILLIARQVRVRSVTLGQPQEPDEGLLSRLRARHWPRPRGRGAGRPRPAPGGFPCAGRANPQTLRSGWRITRTPVIWRWRSTRRSSAAPTQWPSRPIHHGRGTSLGGRLASGWIPFLRDARACRLKRPTIGFGSGSMRASITATPEASSKFVIGLAGGLSRLDDEVEDYLFLTDAGTDGWLTAHLGWGAHAQVLVVGADRFLAPMAPTPSTCCWRGARRPAPHGDGSEKSSPGPTSRNPTGPSSGRALLSCTSRSRGRS